MNRDQTPPLPRVAFDTGPCVDRVEAHQRLRHQLTIYVEAPAARAAWRWTWRAQA